MIFFPFFIFIVHIQMHRIDIHNKQPIVFEPRKISFSHEQNQMENELKVVHAGQKVLRVYVKRLI